MQDSIDRYAMQLFEDQWLFPDGGADKQFAKDLTAAGVKFKVETTDVKALVWHHTDLDSMKGILKSNCLRATRSDHISSDGRDFIRGKPVIESLFKKQLANACRPFVGKLSEKLKATLADNDYNPCYVVSFTQQHDSKAIWTRFPTRTGVREEDKCAIEFNLSELASSLPGAIPVNVLYDQEQWKGVAGDIIQGICNRIVTIPSDNGLVRSDPDGEHFVKMLSGLLLPLYCKVLLGMHGNKKFHDEHEHRLFITGNGANGANLDFSNNTNRHWVEWKPTEGLLPISQIILHQSANLDEVTRDIQELTASIGRPEVTVFQVTNSS